MKFKKLLSLICSIFIIAASFCGCSETEAFVLYFQLNNRPEVLDPQLAENTGSETVVTALFEGLMRYDSAGKLVPAAAESYTCSTDGKTYTFKLREGAAWSDGEAVTASDFVFGLTRALTKKNAAPGAAKLFCIQHAESYYNGGKTAPAVTAASETELKITLSWASTEFLEVLTQPVAMPCRQDFFEKCKGKYGLDKSHLLTNGPFTLYSWQSDTAEDFALRLNRNAAYNGKFLPAASAVILSADSELSGNAERISLGNLDLAYANPGEAGESVASVQLENTSCLLVVNRESDIGGQSFCTALAQTLHRNRLQNDFSTVLNVSEKLLPGVLRVGSVSAAEVKEAAVPAYAPEQALKQYKLCVQKKQPETTSILYYGEENGKLAAAVAEGFQQSLSFFVNTRQCESQEALLQSIVNKEYKIAVLPLTANGNDAVDYLTQLAQYDIVKTNYAAALQNSAKKSETERVQAVEQALQAIAQDGRVMPLAQQCETLIYSKAYSCPNFASYASVLDLALVMQQK